MKKQVTELTDAELLAELQRMKKVFIMDAVLIGFLAGVATFSTVKKGFGLLTFLPVVYLPVAAKNKTRYSELKKLAAEKGLK